MTKIGLLSDTHSHLDEAVFRHFKNCDEIWHAGDIGDLSVMDQLKEFKPVRGVYGNIDDQQVRKEYPLNNRFLCEQVDVWITHIGGYPGRYSPSIRKEIAINPPKLFICGHSHILKVMPDKKLDLLHINPGAAGNHGFHKVKTLIRFSIHEDRIMDLEVIEIPRKG
ncbi:MAG: YfcE family phosphodiesterase [Crocinitomicaceae bacterium]|nr:YfcE family phosphodiesterase [Crocinitomicaceae bacterium]|tara:strand:- start:10013 stop:10510 length:498 start_codon:yes stop_codon:yes gene_type:complete